MTKEELFKEWVRDNYGHEGTLDYTEVMDHYIQSGDFPEDFEESLT